MVAGPPRVTRAHEGVSAGDHVLREFERRLLSVRRQSGFAERLDMLEGAALHGFLAAQPEGQHPPQRRADEWIVGEASRRSHSGGPDLAAVHGGRGPLPRLRFQEPVRRCRREAAFHDREVRRRTLETRAVSHERLGHARRHCPPSPRNSRSCRGWMSGRGRGTCRKRISLKLPFRSVPVRDGELMQASIDDHQSPAGAL
jgi:hypothetical protein